MSEYLRTFHGGVRVETRRYFDPSGKRIRVTRSIFDLASGKPLRDASYLEQEPPVYLSAGALLRAVGASR